jgi:hypothetical protein
MFSSLFSSSFFRSICNLHFATISYVIEVYAFCILLLSHMSYCATGPRVFMSKLHRQRNDIPIGSLFPEIQLSFVKFLFFPQIIGSRYSLAVDDRNNTLKDIQLPGLHCILILPCKRACFYMIWDLMVNFSSAYIHGLLISDNLKPSYTHTCMYTYVSIQLYIWEHACSREACMQLLVSLILCTYISTIYDADWIIRVRPPHSDSSCSSSRQQGCCIYGTEKTRSDIYYFHEQ